MKLHGGLAMAALVMLGVLLPVHVQPGLRREAHRASGLAMLALVALLALTGYGLYYPGDEVWREGTSVTHLAIGVAAALWLVRHRRGQEGARVRIGAEKL
jgi:4-amino-4-deoxy-L-arabinose transferase-like glycosyltransferase